MQKPVLMAFRARLCRLGYTLVSIRKSKKFIDQDVYHVSAVEPLSGAVCDRYMTLMDMFYWR